MLKELVKIANELDDKGLSKEADALDGIIQKIAGEEGETKSPMEVRRGWVNIVSKDKDINELCDILAEAAADPDLDLIRREVQDLFLGTRGNIVAGLENIMSTWGIKDTSEEAAEEAGLTGELEWPSEWPSEWPGEESESTDDTVWHRFEKSFK